MGKQPAFQFYPGDWRRDTEVQMASLATRGVWIEMLCCMWYAKERGKLQGTPESLSRLIGCTTDELILAIKEIEELKIGTVTRNANVTKRNNEITVINRRMYRDEQNRINNLKRQQKFRERKQQGKDEKQKSNAPVTTPSASPTSITPPIPPLKTKKRKGNTNQKKKFYPPWIDLDLWDDFIKYRKTINAPLTDRAEKILMTELEKLINAKQGSQKGIIEQTIASGKWKGFYPVRNKDDPNPVFIPYKPPAIPEEHDRISSEDIRETLQTLRKGGLMK